MKKENEAVNAIGTMFDIVEAIKDLEGATLTELSEAAGVAKSTVHRHLQSLRRHEYVVQEDDEYYIGTRFLELGEFARSRLDVYDLVQSRLRDIADETGERAQFLVEEHGYGVFVSKEAGENAVDAGAKVGWHFPIHISAGGKAILAEMPEEDVRAIIDRHGLPEVTEKAITDEDRLMDELETIRERGYAFNDEESIIGVRAVGVSMCGPNNEVLGGLTVTGPSHRLEGEWFREEVPKLLLGIANEVELKYAYD